MPYRDFEALIVDVDVKTLAENDVKLTAKHKKTPANNTEVLLENRFIDLTLIQCFPDQNITALRCYFTNFNSLK